MLGHDWVRYYKEDSAMIYHNLEEFMGSRGGVSYCIYRPAVEPEEDAEENPTESEQTA